MCYSNREKREILRRLKAAGCPIEVDVPPLEFQAEVTIIQTADAYLFDMGNRGIGIALCVRLAREKPGQITIVEFGDVHLPWRTQGVMWLDRRPPSSLPVYRLPNGFDFPGDNVLNHRFGEEGLRLRSGRCVEGYVLGTTLGRIPDRHIHGCIVDAEFSVLDALGHEFRGPVRFLVDRSTAPLSQRRSARPGVGEPRGWPLERAADPVDEPSLDTPNQQSARRISPSASLLVSPAT